MKAMVRFMLLTLLVVLSLFVLIPSYQLLGDVRCGNEPALAQLPKPPVPPPAFVLAAPDLRLDAGQQLEVYKRQVEGYAQGVNVFAQEVTAYTQHVNAYKLYAESTGACPQMTAYQLVVKDTLIGLVPAFITILLGYAFTSAGASVLNNMIRAKKGDSVESWRIL